VWLTFNGPLLLLRNNKPVRWYTRLDGHAGDGDPNFIDVAYNASLISMPMTGAGIWANHTRIVLKSTTTIIGNNQSAVYLNSSSASFAAVHMLNNRAKDALLVFASSTVTFNGDFSCAQDVNPLELDLHISAASTTCVLATDSKVDFTGPACFINNVQERYVTHLDFLHHGTARVICSKDNLPCRHAVVSTLPMIPAGRQQSRNICDFAAASR
jgi:hypothetical protein